ncbi:MAG: aminotransferase class IV [Verrucomicrobiales bacterium]|nr:aminotransferase class IV [Verrucomicrobiales bacterium]
MPLPDAPFLVHNGRLRPATEALVQAHDGLVICGRGIFETIAAYRGTPFRANEHLERLSRGATVFDLPFPEVSTLLAAMQTALEANALLDAEKARLRLTLSAPGDGSASWWIEATPPPPHPVTARVITGPFFRNERSPLAGLKTINYGENVVALRLAREAGADEALFANTRDELCEGTWSNAFVRIDGVWHTPPLSSGCLPGITRGVVIGLFEEHGLSLAESALSYTALDRVESAFLTSSLREIQPIAAIDGKELEIAAETIVLQSSYRSLAS